MENKEVRKHYFKDAINKGLGKIVDARDGIRETVNKPKFLHAIIEGGAKPFEAVTNKLFGEKPKIARVSQETIEETYKENKGLRENSIFWRTEALLYVNLPTSYNCGDIRNEAGKKVKEAFYYLWFGSEEYLKISYDIVTKLAEKIEKKFPESNTASLWEKAGSIIEGVDDQRGYEAFLKAKSTRAVDVALCRLMNIKLAAETVKKIMPHKPDWAGKISEKLLKMEKRIQDTTLIVNALKEPDLEQAEKLYSKFKGEFTAMYDSSPETIFGAKPPPQLEHYIDNHSFYQGAFDLYINANGTTFGHIFTERLADVTKYFWVVYENKKRNAKFL